jgi:hypothetical protein
LSSPTRQIRPKKQRLLGMAAFPFLTLASENELRLKGYCLSPQVLTCPGTGWKACAHALTANW